MMFNEEGLSKENSDENKVDDKVKMDVNEIKSSYASITKEHDLDNKLNLVPTEIGEDGIEVVMFDEETVKEDSKKWALTVCGYFVGYKMSYQELTYNLYRMWGKFSLRSIIPNGNGIFMFKFKNEDRIKTEPNKLPLWVKFRNLPLETWSTKGISAIASRLGTPFIMDSVTANMCNARNGRVGFSRVLIEVEAGKGVPNQVDIMYKNKDNIVTGKKTMKVEYDWVPHVCSYCNVFGHSVENCGCRPKTVKEIAEMIKKRQEEEATNNMDNNEFVQVRNMKKPSKFVKQPDKNKENNHGIKKNNVIYKQVVKEKSSGEGVKESDKGSDVGSVNKEMNESPGVKTWWNVHKDVIDTIRKIANKYSVLDDYDDTETMAKNCKSNDEEDDVYEVRTGSASKVTKNVLQSSYANILNAPGGGSGSKLLNFMDFKIVAWNIRGLGKGSKQTACDKRCRILVGWNADIVRCRVIHASNQAMLCLVETITSKESIMCTFIHAKTTTKLRRKLWSNLNAYKSICNNIPWVLLGDINVSLNMDEHSEGISHKTQDMEEFQDCVNSLKIEDVVSVGFHFTWTKSLLNPDSSVLNKINRVIGNEALFYVHKGAHTVFLPYGISDHCPVVLTVSKSLKACKKSFRFANYIADKKGFKQLLEDKWNIDVEGIAMFKLNSDNSYLRDILGEILGKDMHYPFTRFV
ncbi:RNA-directed DNA polymerase, eukaryota, reverse transcriptase zinc-binding domain protein [Tanacetum coccineum]